MSYVENATYFRVHEVFEAQSHLDIPKQFCVAIERPSLTLARIVAGISRNKGKTKKHIALKIGSALRSIAKSIRYVL